MKPTQLTTPDGKAVALLFFHPGEIRILWPNDTMTHIRLMDHFCYESDESVIPDHPSDPNLGGSASC